MAPFALQKPTSPPSALNLFQYLELVSWKVGRAPPGWGDDLPRYPERFDEAVRVIGTDPRGYFIGFEEQLLVHRVRELGFDVYRIAIPAKSDRVSASNDHPNAARHDFIAQQLYPFIERLLSKQIMI